MKGKKYTNNKKYTHANNMENVKNTYIQSSAKVTENQFHTMEIKKKPSSNC